jgi:hypothetical protein
VPGTWALPPAALLWTPAYWAYSDGEYVLYDVYWAPEVGFYGGIDYGFGYTGYGYEGGYWNNGTFFYNSAVNNISNLIRSAHFHDSVAQHARHSLIDATSVDALSGQPDLVLLDCGRDSRSHSA